MERYNYTAAGMVPADGGDWVKAEDILAADTPNPDMTTIEMRIEFPSGVPPYREATHLTMLTPEEGGGTSLDDCNMDVIRIRLHSVVEELADFLAKHQKERKA